MPKVPPRKDIKDGREPVDRLTRMCDVMTRALYAHPEYNQEIDKCIVFLDDGSWGGMQFFGYDSDAEALGDLFQHIQAIFARNGVNLSLMPFPPSSSDPEAN